MRPTIRSRVAGGCLNSRHCICAERPNRRLMLVEHDTGLVPRYWQRRSPAFRQYHCAFDHKVARFVVMERLNPGCASRHAQPAWLADDLGQLPADAQIVMLTHRPTFRSLSALGLGNHPWRAGHSNAHRAEKRSTRRARPDHARHSDALECSKLPRAYGHCSRCRIPGLRPDAGWPTSIRV
jgi:hypothetical protein